MVSLVFFFFHFISSSIIPSQYQPESTESSKQRLSLLIQAFQTCSPNCIFYPHFKQPSKFISFDKLKPVNLKGMVFPFHHINTFFLCRVVSDVFHSYEVRVVVEDLNGDSVILSLFGYLEQNETFPIGTILAIKEPYLDLEGSYPLLRCSSPSDVLVVDETDEIFLGNTKWLNHSKQSLNELISQAKFYFEKNDFTNSLKFCNRGLKITRNNNDLLFIKVNILLNQHRYFEAHETLLFFPKLNDEKVLLLLGRAAYGMRNWTLAADYYSQLLLISPNDKLASQELSRARQRLDESLNGNYDFNQIAKEYFESIAQKQLYFSDVADYIGPITILENKIQGKYGVASRNISKGTLLFAFKAVSFSSDANESEHSIYLPSIQSDYLNMSSNSFKSFRSLISELKNNPNRTDEIYILFSGSVDRSESISQGIIDTLRCEQIYKLNSFESTNRALEQEGGFGLPVEKPLIGRGLWTFPALLNHHCSNNAERIFYGDLMIAYALTDIQEGEEVTVSYLLPDVPYSERQELCQNHFHFTCTCALCTEQKNDPLDDFRYQLTFNKSKEFFSLISKRMVTQGYDALISLVQQLNESYKNTTLKYQLPLLQAFSVLGSVQLQFKKYQAAIETFQQALSLRPGYSSIRISILLRLASCYHYISKMENAYSVLNELFDFAHSSSGMTPTIFKYHYQLTMKYLNLTLLVDQYIQDQQESLAKQTNNINHDL